MLGFFLAITSSALFAARDSLQKHLASYTSPLVVYWSAVLFALPVFAVGVWLQGWAEITGPFWYMVALGVPLYIGSSVLLVRAMQVSPLSLTLPFLAFSPAFLLLTSWLILNQVPTTLGIIGIILVTLGAYFIHFQGRQGGWLAPVQAIRRERGSWYVIIVALIWSITANFDKIAIDNSSPLTYLFVYHIVAIIGLTLALAIRRELSDVRIVRKKPLLFPLAGLLTGFAVLLQMMAIQFILVPYMITIKRAGSILGGISIGAALFKEPGFQKKFSAGILMLLGVALILIWG